MLDNVIMFSILFDVVYMHMNISIDFITQNKTDRERYGADIHPV